MFGRVWWQEGGGEGVVCKSKNTVKTIRRAEKHVWIGWARIYNWNWARSSYRMLVDAMSSRMNEITHILLWMSICIHRIAMASIYIYNWLKETSSYAKSDVAITVNTYIYVYTDKCVVWCACIVLGGLRAFNHTGRVFMTSKYTCCSVAEIVFTVWYKYRRLKKYYDEGYI